MKTELCVFAALLVCVLGGLRTPEGRDSVGPLPRRPGPEGTPVRPAPVRPAPEVPSGPRDPGPPSPDRPIRPWWPAYTCRVQNGGWGYEALPQNKWPTSNNPKVFYIACKVWRPTWSRCTGTCQSSHNFSTGMRPRETTDCKCCRSTATSRCRPYPKCWVIRFDHGQFLSAKFETVRQRVDYSYYTAARCGCTTCSQRYPSIWAKSDVDGLAGRPGPSGQSDVEDVEEDDVVGRPVPPAPTSAERDFALGLAGRINPDLRGALPREEERA